MGYVRQYVPPKHRCGTPLGSFGADGAVGDLWRCDECGSLWRLAEACAWCDRYGVSSHRGSHEVGRKWRPATLWQRVWYRSA